MHVSKGQVLYYYASSFDLFDARTDLKNGEQVRVVHPSGCPPPNTMGHCHVERLDGTFVGLVCTASLRMQPQ